MHRHSAAPLHRCVGRAKPLPQRQHHKGRTTENGVLIHSTLQQQEIQLTAADDANAYQQIRRRRCTGEPANQRLPHHAEHRCDQQQAHDDHARTVGQVLHPRE